MAFRVIANSKRECYKALGIIHRNLSPLAQAREIKKVKITDLLGRVPIKIENSIIKREISGKRILITGAAGQIGYQLAFRIASGQLLGQGEKINLKLYLVQDLT